MLHPKQARGGSGEGPAGQTNPHVLSHMRVEGWAAKKKKVGGRWPKMGCGRLRRGRGGEGEGW